MRFAALSEHIMGRLR